MTGFVQNATVWFRDQNNINYKYIVSLLQPTFFGTEKKMLVAFWESHDNDVGKH